jgi:protein TonB
VPAPGRFLTIPKGAEVPTPPLPSQQSQTPPPPQASPAPEVNLLPPELRMLAPPEPQPDVQATQQPMRAARRQHTRTRTAPNPSPFASPQEFSFASRPSAPVARGLRNSKSVDLSLGRPERGGASDYGMLHFTSPGASGSYAELLHEYVEEHKYYPEQAIENQEQGMPVISATLTRDGRVRNLRLVESSGSPSLDMAWFGLFRTMHLPPFPPEMTVPQLDFTYAIEYELIRR